MASRPDRTRVSRLLHRASRTLLLLLAAGASSCAKTKLAELQPRDRKLLLIGVDGLDFDLVKPLFDEGKLPRLAELRRRGILVPIIGERATMDPYSGGLDPAESWTSIATGFSPTRTTESGGSHGVRNITVPVKGSYPELPATSQHRKQMNFWDVLGASGVKCAVVGWWTTWPAEPVNGYLVTDRFFLEKFGLTGLGPAGRVDLPGVAESYRHGADHLTWPESLADPLAQELRPSVMGPKGEVFTALKQLLAKASGATLKSLQQVEQAVRTDFAMKDALVGLVRKDPSIRFATCYLDALDVACHLFWMHIHPQPWVQHADPSIRLKLPKDYKDFAGVIPMVAITIDVLVNELCAAMGPDALVMLVTDHTLEPDADIGNRDFNLNRLLEKIGLLVRNADGSVDYAKSTCFDHTVWPRHFIRYLSINFEGEWPNGFVAGGSPQVRSAKWREVQAKLFDVKIDKSYVAADGAISHDLFLGCHMGEKDSQFVVYQALPGDTKVKLASGDVSLNAIFPPLQTSGRHIDPGMLLLSYPGELGDRYGKRGIPMGKGGGYSRQVAPLVLGLYGIPGSERDDESGVAHDMLYWMLDVDEAQRLVLMPRVKSYEEAVGFEDPERPLGRRRAELREYLEKLGYDFESFRTLEKLEPGGVKDAESEEAGGGEPAGQSGQDGQADRVGQGDQGDQGDR